MKLLVAGDARVDAGKTTFAAGLVSSLDGAVGFKPRAGNDYWYDHDDVATALEDGRLYGKDVATLAAAVDAADDADDADDADTTLSEEQLNPVHRLWRPTPGRTGLLGETDRTFLVDRVTTAAGSSFVVNGTAERAGLFPESVAASLPLGDARRVETVETFNELMAEMYLPAFERVAHRIESTTPAVVESYGDISMPAEGIEFDAVAVVDPTRVRIYDGSRYLKAREVAAGSLREGRLEERVGRVVEMIKPQSTHELDALTGEDRADPERVASRYEPAYETLIEAALR